VLIVLKLIIVLLLMVHMYFAPCGPGAVSG